MTDLSKLTDAELVQMLASHPDVQKKGTLETITDKFKEGASKALSGNLIEASPEYKAWNRQHFGVESLSPENLGAMAVDATGSPAAGVATNFVANAIPALFGFRPGPATAADLARLAPADAARLQNAQEPIRSLAEGPAKWLMNKAVKAAPEDILDKSASRAYSTMLREGQMPTPSGMLKAQKIINELHPQVQAGIAQSSAEIPIAPIGERYLEQYTKAIPQGQSAVKEVSDVWKNFSTNPAVAGSDSMTAQMADLLKRGTQMNARANYGKPTGAAEKALGSYLRDALLEKVPSIRELLAREAENANVLDVARKSVATATKANPAGLAALRADDAVPALGFLADRSPFFKGLLAHMLYQGGRPEMAMPAAAAAQNLPEIFSRE